MNDASEYYPFEKVGAKALERFQADESLKLLVLPSVPRGDAIYYSEFDSTVVSAARQAGISEVSYLDDYDERRHIHEYGAGWLLDIALAIPANLAADVILLLVRYLWIQMKNAKSRGLLGESDAAGMRLSIGSFERHANGDLKIEDLVASGDAASVVKAVVEVFAPQHLESAMQELEALESVDEIDE